MDNTVLAILTVLAALAVLAIAIFHYLNLRELKLLEERLKKLDDEMEKDLKDLKSSETSDNTLAKALDRAKESLEKMRDSLSDGHGLSQGIALAKALISYKEKDYTGLGQVLAQHFNIKKIFEKDIGESGMAAIGQGKNIENGETRIIIICNDGSNVEYDPKEFCERVIDALNKAKNKDKDENTKKDSSEDGPDWLNQAN